ncbi:nucleotide exchange factor GrpE [Microvirga mediterraneensis]|uniref:Protein GrpE n=1 Tax=Microvirga mediterraneensis TaxID=2754695 RepID=A0A838BTE5_9HYPH|nr:nucleotide exchange factor GrpE [Microvirga mediterraneensis]MBA1158701.1 nucleotide exchange factor GrpE [Microvirga mediterraneensis]
MNPNDTENHNAAPQAEPATDAAPAAASAPEADPIAVLEAEKADLKDKLLRLMADMENLRRRTEREIADARTYGVANFARDMLNVADNIHRAIESVPQEARSTAEGAFKGLIEGIDLTERDLLKTLERHGVKKLDPQGQKFDPNVHQAMFEIPNAEVPNGTVLQVVQSGYVIGERVLRPALVGVSKGGPKAAANGAEATDNSSTAQ